MKVGHAVTDVQALMAIGIATLPNLQRSTGATAVLDKTRHQNDRKLAPGAFQDADATVFESLHYSVYSTSESEMYRNTEVEIHTCVESACPSCAASPQALRLHHTNLYVSADDSKMDRRE